MVNYSGNVWALLMKRTVTADRRTLLDEIDRYLRAEYGVACLGSLGFENAYALAMRREDARKYRISSIGDLARHAPRWRIAGDLQIFSRPEWRRVRAKYKLKFARTLPMDPTLMYPAIDRGSVEVICAYTSDGRIKSSDLVLLEDPEQAFPPYDAILLVSPKAAGRPNLLAALRPLVGAIDVEQMRRANGRVDVERRRPRQAGRELLEQLRAARTKAGAP